MPWGRSILLIALIFLLLLTPGCSLEPGLSEGKVLPLSSDIIIVGDGIGGLTAALEAARKGAAVILFSEEPLDEHWMWEEGALCPGDSGKPEPLEEILAATGEGRGKKWHYKLLARNAATDLAWLSRETGLRMAREERFRCFPENLSYDQLHKRLKEKLLQEGVRFIEGVVLEELLFNENGEAAGINFFDPAGVLNTAYAPAIILADGGYLNDPEQVKELAPDTAVASWRHSGRGTGIKLARAAGLEIVDEALFSYTLAVEKDQNWVPVEPPPGTLLIVDRQILLFSQYDEAELVKMLVNSASGNGYLLVAGAGLRPEHEPDWPRYNSVAAFMESYKLQIPELNRRFRNPQATFFGCPVKPVASYCLGGIAINESGLVLQKDQPVKGLYALGETAGALNGAAIMPGAALTEALVWGRHLGTVAARQIE
ncbi:MAG: FAD-dependent oxidoreductase [Dethiobacteria bacterium]